MIARLVLIGLALAASSSANAQTFHGYPCTQDCSGHEAGYEWAEQQGITDPYGCGGNSNSFIEGCQAWADENGSDYSDEEADDYDDEGDGDW